MGKKCPREFVERVMLKKGIPAVLIAALIGACAQPAKFLYPQTQQQMGRISEKPKYGLRVAVLPFEDSRGDRNSMMTFWLGLLPLAPFGFVAHQRPDTARFFNTVSAFEFDASRDMAKAVVTSLRQSGLFSHVYFAPEGEQENADLIVSGRVHRTLYRGRTYTYCISVAAAALWVLGLPVGDSTAELEFDLTVQDQGKQKRIWGGKSQSSKRIVQGLYYGWGDDVNGYAELTEQAMKEMLERLDQTMAKIEKEQGRSRPSP